ncbi:Alpha/Beta hydrolase protein [Cladorrhinum samala]|uniref:Alpha/Beta hydrolase protein n=1 Tax=Cladorrhinum samala TaxID=585594 RepID=A0AAV9HT71_9PEZI|nr:Alpha/Beta hydrolase protein [Cladorrhinum samala]
MAQSADIGSQLKADYTTETFQQYYERLDVTYKTVNSTDIKTAVFIPKSLIGQNKAAHKPTTTPVPLIVHWHGGGFITGANPEPAWFANWVQDLPVSPRSSGGVPSIILSPAYRLAPESYVFDALQDVQDFWLWLHSPSSPLASVLAPYSLTPSLSQILTVGESAGGYLSLQSSLLFQEISKVNAVVSQYGAAYPDLWPLGWKQNGNEDGNTTPRPNPEADKVIADYKASLAPGAIRSSSPFPQLMDVTFAYLATGRIVELYGRNETEREYTSLGYALGRKQKSLPPIWFLQGTRDSLVPKPQADELIRQIQKTYPKVQLKYTVRDGEHGWDSFYPLTRDWIAEGVEFVKKAWLQGKN